MLDIVEEYCTQQNIRGPFFVNSRLFSRSSSGGGGGNSSSKPSIAKEIVHVLTSDPEKLTIRKRGERDGDEKWSAGDLTYVGITVAIMCVVAFSVIISSQKKKMR